MIDLKPIIKAYIFRWKDEIYPKEKYKLRAVNRFHQHFFAKEDMLLDERLKLSLSAADNLLASNNYFPAGMMFNFAKERSKATLQALDTLFDNSMQLRDRIASFMDQMGAVFKDLKEHGFQDWKDRSNVQSFQDTHATSVYLALRYPDLYYIYKWSVFQTAANKLGYQIKSKDKIDKLIEFYALCEEVKKQILEEKEFLDVYNKQINKDGFVDKHYNMLTQDFIYATTIYLDGDYSWNSKKRKYVRNVIETKVADYRVTASKADAIFKGKKGIDYAKKDEFFHNIGADGEIWVLNYEKKRLLDMNVRFDVEHTSVYKGDGLGYDILSVEDDGKTPRYIEVKTTTGGIEQPLYFTKTELERSIHDKEHYYIYRVLNFKSADSMADLIILKGSLAELNAVPLTYKASLDNK